MPEVLSNPLSVIIGVSSIPTLCSACEKWNSTIYSFVVKRLMIASLTTSTPTIIDVPVPGYLPKKKRSFGKRRNVAQVQKLLSEDSRVNADAAIKWALQLHSTGRSLNGKFEASDLRMDPCYRVKCADAKRVLLKNANTKKKRKDFKRIRKIIKHDILGVQCEDDLPNDVKLLLDLLKAYQAGDEILIAHHPGLMKEDEKIAVFNRMLSELEALMVTDPQKYQRIITALPYEKGYWKALAYCNQHVRGFYTYNNRMSNYADTPEGALYLYRNCFQHLIKDHSTQVQGGVTVVLFIHKQMEHMLGTILPGFIVKMMVELHNEAVLGSIF